MKLFVGLGNPGPDYKQTRHNVGFMFIDTFLNKLGLLDKYKNTCQGLVYKTKINQEVIFILKPLTYMNLSGLSVRALMDYYKIPVEDLYVIHDDMDFEVGHFKLKAHGSGAGHNGIKSIIEHLGTDQFKRIRVGIGRAQRDEQIDYVLGKFSKAEMEMLQIEALKVCDALMDVTKMSFQNLMTKYNTQEQTNEETDNKIN